jgi:hypothetical protein
MHCVPGGGTGASTLAVAMALVVNARLAAATLRVRLLRSDGHPRPDLISGVPVLRKPLDITKVVDAIRQAVGP